MSSFILYARRLKEKQDRHSRSPQANVHLHLSPQSPRSNKMSTAACSFTYELQDVKDPAKHNTLLLALANLLPHDPDLQYLCTEIRSTEPKTKDFSNQLLKTFDCTIVVNSRHPAWPAQSTLPMSEPPEPTKLALPNTFPDNGWEFASNEQRHRRSLGHLGCFKHHRTLMKSVSQGGECDENQQRAIAKSVQRLADSKAHEVFCAVLGRAVDEYNSDKTHEARRLSAFAALRDAASKATEEMIRDAFTVEASSASQLCLSTMCYTLGDKRTTEEMLNLLKHIHTARGEEDDQSRLVTEVLSRVDPPRGQVKSLINESIVLTSKHDVWTGHLFKFRKGSGKSKYWGVTLVNPPRKFPARGWTLANDKQRLMRRCGDDPTISWLSHALRLGGKKVEPSLLLEKTKKLLDHDVSTPGVKELLTHQFQQSMDKIHAEHKACNSILQKQEETQILTSLPEFIALEKSLKDFLPIYNHFVFTVAPEEVNSTTIEPASDGSPSA